jgi:MoaA/NifB/PqqE/SkfB family radical SAM enzyme
MNSEQANFSNDYGPQRLSLELVNICNLHCSYCFRSEDDLYSSKAEYFPIQLLKKVLDDSKRVAGATRVIFTGGEPTLHPQFDESLTVVAEAGMTSSFVTNGWHFDRVWPAVSANRESIDHVAFSLDGISRDSHDRWRGAGSFDRLVRAFSRCHISGLRFAIKIAIRRDTAEQLEQIAMFAARMGASALNFVHLMPTSVDLANGDALDIDERRIAEEEIALLSRIFKMHIGIDVGYYNIDEHPPCSPLAGTSMNVDYRGRLSLCCNLSGFRGGAAEADAVGDLNSETFESAHRKLLAVATAQLKKRNDRLAELRNAGVSPDLFTGSPCLFCLQSFEKVPWHDKLYKVAINVAKD